MKIFLRENIDITFIIIFLGLILIGVFTKYQEVLDIANVFAIVGFLIVQQPQNKTPDERDYYLNYKASSLAFLLTLTFILIINVLLDFDIALTNISSSDLLTWIISFMFITYTATYAYIKRKH